MIRVKSNHAFEGRLAKPVIPCQATWNGLCVCTRMMLENFILARAELTGNLSLVKCFLQCLNSKAIPRFRPG